MKYGLWEPMVMFFGLTNSPVTFQAMMDSIYRPIVEKWAQRGIVWLDHQNLTYWKDPQKLSQQIARQ